ncbi:hypothetical protein JXA80_07095 [bacterium]|nr:hypothetical protein [candidate division CSSED10-310 bacterium]
MTLFETLTRESIGSRRVIRAMLGVFSVVVETEERTGLASCFRDPCGNYLNDFKGVGELHRISTDTLMRGYETGNLLQKSLAVSALNASLPDPQADYIERHGQDIIETMGTDAHVAVVGQFPFVTGLSRRVRKLTVIHEEPHEGKKGIERARVVFPEADIIVITSSAFINGSIDTLLDLASHAWVMLLGATTPMHPLLFNYGVDVLSGIEVVDRQHVFDGVCEATPFRFLKGIRRVTWDRSAV